MAVEKVIIKTDGASRGNPGAAAIGAIIKDERGGTLACIAQKIGRTTNNQAEYRAVIAALEQAIRLGARKIELNSDSELVVRQLIGRYRVKKPALQPLHQQVKELLEKFDSVTIKCIPREQNIEADRLANSALDAA